MSTAISISNLRKSYTNDKDTTDAVKGISFDIAEGEFFGFLGPNGAGKTSTISCMTGLAEITSGNITVFGKDVVKDYKEARKLIGLAAQEPNFDPFFELTDVLEFQAGYYGMARREAKKRAEMLLKRFDLWEHRKKTPRQISGGMKRRLLIAKALVHDPKVLVLDEPTAGVDVELRRDLWKFLRELNEEGTTILLTTHYIEEAEELCNRIGIINKGEMVRIDKKEALMDQLSEKSVVLHVSEMNDALKEALCKREDCTVDGVKINLNGEKVHEHLQEAVALVEKHGARVLDVDVKQFDLEDIFMQLTNE